MVSVDENVEESTPVTFKQVAVSKERCTIQSVKKVDNWAYQLIILELINDETGFRQEIRVPIPKQLTEVSPNTNFGRPAKEFGLPPTKWVGKHVDLVIEQHGKRMEKRIYPVKEETVAQQQTLPLQIMS